MQRRISIILAVIIILLTGSITAFAQPLDAQTLSVRLSNYPSECAFIDLLVELDETSGYYTQANTENMQAQHFDTTELAKYSEEGFLSYTCHFKGAYKDISIKDGYVLVAEHEQTSKIMAEKLSVKIAVLDKNGHILKVSDSITICDKRRFLVDLSDLKYDYLNDKVDANIYFEPDYSGLVTVFIILISVVTVLIVFLFVHSISKSLKSSRNSQKDDVQVNEETTGGYFKTIFSLTFLFFIFALIYGFAFTDLVYYNHLHPSVENYIILFCVQMLPLVLMVVTAVKIKDFTKFVIPDFVFGFILAQFAGKNTLLLLDIFIFIVVQVVSVFLAVVVSHFTRKRKRGVSHE